MQRNFDPVSYAIDVGRELISSFTQAGQATTPGLVGSARETPTRKRLEHLLPSGIAVGSGCVIDSYGGTSKQMDVVLYENHLCPEYSINDDPATTYYPCEGVIAVGEIKSCMASTDLEDTFAKIASVKKLRRFARPKTDELVRQPSVPFRAYGSSISIGGTVDEQFDQDTKPFDQIFGFALAGSLGLQPETLCTKYAEMAALHERPLSPNLIVTLEDNQVLAPLCTPPSGKLSIGISAREADSICCVTRPEGGFQFLLARIYTVYRQGRTVERVAFDRYFARDGRLTLPINGPVVPLK
ncbi:MAG: hypothetical protein F4Y80_09440 [Caldilineaceae bacterium SB0665_bin_21]|nr:hypothetical protein [Caldilineaceae bacterium SB0665_bin_21]MYA04435.1 hypothetical protein [Caldilineaceae bacterium SB0664_bin_22]